MEKIKLHFKLISKKLLNLLNKILFSDTVYLDFLPIPDFWAKTFGKRFITLTITVTLTVISFSNLRTCQRNSKQN